MSVAKTMGANMNILLTEVSDCPSLRLPWRFDSEGLLSR